MSEPTVWRLHITQEEHVRVQDRCHFCVQEEVAGMGWGVDCEEQIDWPEYCIRARTKYDGVDDNVRRLYGAVKRGDLVWSRDTKGKYFLGQILNGWEYRSSQNHRDADIHNVRRCKWLLVGDMSEVPGTIRNAFIRGQTLRSIPNKTIIWFSIDLFNRLSGASEYTLPQIESNLLALLDPDACEDLVGIFLQSQGWILYPSTCKTETQNYEFTLRNAITGRMAAVQVKQGGQRLDVSEYEQFDGDIFLFQTDANYSGTPQKATTTLLDPDTMTQFCIDNVHMMPTPIKRWVDWVKRI